MKLYSTRNSDFYLHSKDAIIKGLSDDGGLFCPLYEDIEKHKFDIKDLLTYDYKKTAKFVFNIFLDDFSDEELEKCINAAYSNNFNLSNSKDFQSNNSNHTITPITKIGKNFLLELYHGPTSAFKDVALTTLPQFLTTAYKSKNENKKIYILTATSGDTGKAALSGFKNVENTFITVFYPTDGVSNIQKLQMQTSEGNNVSVVAIKGDFDDCQKLVKEIYTDKDIKKLCDENNVVLSSANSINIGRLVPQIVYYIQSYIDLVYNKQINLYDKINFVVPTGNFGNILAGYIAKLLGLPINKLICASNDNNVLTDFINTGCYNKNRKLFKTISPSMDILVSSNLERLLFLLSSDSKLICKLMDSLYNENEYAVPEDLLKRINDTFVAFYANEEECRNTIKESFENDNRIIDTHTAIAYACLKKYQKTYPNATEPTVILSTASPYKFARDVLKCIYSENVDSMSDFDCVDKLYNITNEDIPKNLLELKNKTKLFDTTLDYNSCKKFVTDKIINCI